LYFLYFHLFSKRGLSALHAAVIEDKGDEVDMLNNIGVDLDCKSKVGKAVFIQFRTKN
jgi:hypothetical protein